MGREQPIYIYFRKVPARRRRLRAGRGWRRREVAERGQVGEGADGRGDERHRRAARGEEAIQVIG